MLEDSPPTNLVFDCSISIPWYLEDEQTEFTLRVFRQLADIKGLVPALWRLEFANALLMAERRGRIDKRWRVEAIERASRLPITVDTYVVSLAAISRLASDHGLTTYDAVYLELALRRKFTLATLDAALVEAARKAGCPLLTDFSLYPPPEDTSKSRKK